MAGRERSGGRSAGLCCWAHSGVQPIVSTHRTVDRERIMDLTGRQGYFKFLSGLLGRRSSGYGKNIAKGSRGASDSRRGRKASKKGDGSRISAIRAEEVEFKAREPTAPRLAHNGVGKTQCWGAR